MKAHLDTLSADGESVSLRDIIEQGIIPILAGLGAWAFGADISAGTAAGILTLSGIFSAFFFQLGVQLLDRAADWAEQDPNPGPETSAYANLLGQLSANANYAALVSGAACVGSLMVSITKAGWPEHLAAGFVVAALAHLGTTLLLVANRVFLLTRARLLAARSGQDRSV